MRNCRFPEAYNSLKECCCNRLVKIRKNLTTKELKQIWNSAIVVVVDVATIAAAVAIAILEQRQRRFRTGFKREIKGCTKGEFAEINWELNPSYSSIVLMFSIYSWGCVSWMKLCSLFFFCKP